MEKHTFFIPRISCGHCVTAIINEITDIKGVLTVSGDAVKKEMVVEWTTPATLEKIQAALKEMNYPAD
ncbi:MAG: heavy-metal-associated domain-containing protein [Thermodesulfobacteriota bacterium]